LINDELRFGTPPARRLASATIRMIMISVFVFSFLLLQSLSTCWSDS
jgi:hypothetical protein